MIKHHFIALQSILIKEITRFCRIWLQTLLPPAITMTLYFVIFGNLIGPRIGLMNGFPYIVYITPGLIMMAVITHSYSNVVSSFFSAKYQHHVEELLVSPVPNVFILLGYVGGGVCRGVLTGIIVTCVSLFFVELSIDNVLIVIVVIFLTSILFSLGGFINAVYARNFDDISIVPTFILTPLTYLGGVFYSLSLLPDFWQNVSRLNPILYMVNAFRYGFLGHSDINLMVALGIIVVFILVLFAYALYLLNVGKGLKS